MRSKNTCRPLFVLLSHFDILDNRWDIEDCPKFKNAELYEFRVLQLVCHAIQTIINNINIVHVLKRENVQ